MKILNDGMPNSVMISGISSMCCLQDRRDVERVVDHRVAVRRLEHVRQHVAVRAGAVHVVLAGAHVGDARGDTALRGRPALADRVLGQVVVDAPVLVHVDDAGEGQLPARVDDLGSLGDVDAGLDTREPAVLDGDVDGRHVGGVRVHHAGILDHQVIRCHRTSCVVTIVRSGTSTGSTSSSSSSLRNRRPQRVESVVVQETGRVVAELRGQFVEGQRVAPARRG